MTIDSLLEYMNRREFLGTCSGVGVIGVAGCLNDDEQTDGIVYDSESPLANNLEGRPMEGDEDAPNTIVGIDDPSCPFCGDFRLENYPEVRDKLIDDGEVKYYSILIDLIHPWSSTAVPYLESVYQKGDSEDYFELLEFYYQEEESISEDNVVEASEEYIEDYLEFDVSEITSEVEADEHEEFLSQIKTDVEDAGISTTPTFAVFRGDQLVTELSGVQTVDTFERLL